MGGGQFAEPAEHALVVIVVEVDVGEDERLVRVEGRAQIRDEQGIGRSGEIDALDERADMAGDFTEGKWHGNIPSFEQ